MALWAQLICDYQSMWCTWKGFKKSQKHYNQLKRVIYLQMRRGALVGGLGGSYAAYFLRSARPNHPRQTILFYQYATFLYKNEQRTLSLYDSRYSFRSSGICSSWTGLWLSISLSSETEKKIRQDPSLVCMIMKCTGLDNLFSVSTYDPKSINLLQIIALKRERFHFILNDFSSAENPFFFGYQRLIHIFDVVLVSWWQRDGATGGGGRGEWCLGVGGGGGGICRSGARNRVYNRPVDLCVASLQNLSIQVGTISNTYKTTQYVTTNFFRCVAVCPKRPDQKPGILLPGGVFCKMNEGFSSTNFARVGLVAFCT